MSSNSIAAQIPVLAGFQFDASTVTEGVNLFRGNVAFPLKLLSLPGRNSLTFDVTILYESNVERAVDTWNLEAAGDVLGVGWSMPYDRIVTDPRRTGTRLDDSYFLISQGQTTPLVAIPSAWARGSVSAAAAAPAPGPVGRELTRALASSGICLSSAARLEPAGGGAWHVHDDRHERSYRLVPAAQATFDVQSGGQAFEVASQPFWQAVYYADYERWEITKDDGSTLSFGGSGEAVQPGQAPNVISWGVRWGNWIGASTMTQAQSRYATAWNLARLEDSVGNGIVFNYQVTEQAVGFGTLTYTKECHLSAVRNDLGWTCAFDYAAMTYQYDSLTSPKEYLDPHRDPSLPPSNAPDAYQSAYNTRYLTRIRVANDQAEEQLALRFDYYPLQNLTQLGASGLAYGATYKRYLKSITEVFPGGATRPPVAFEYLFTSNTDQNRGALSRIVYPSGGASSFTYVPISVGGDGPGDPGARNLKIANPFGGGTAAPRTWYSADYVVCAWYSADQQRLLLNVFTWVGRWYQWQPTWLAFDGAVELDALQVATSRTVFMLSLPAVGGSNTDVYLFNRRHLAAGDWEFEGGATSPIAHPYATGGLTVAGGDDFFVVADSTNAVVDRYAWNWMTRGWDIAHISQSGFLCQTSGGTYAYYLAAGESYHLVMCYDTSRQLTRFSLSYRDPLLAWQSGGTLDASDINIRDVSGMSYAALSPAGSFAALAWATNFTPAGSDDFTFDYQLRVLVWDESYQNLNVVQLPSVPDTGFSGVPSPILRAVGPVFVDNTLVASGPNLFRYDGQQWSYQFLGIRYRNVPDPQEQYYWYAYSSDAALVTENTSAGVYSALFSFDPNQPQYGWQVQVLTDLQGSVPGRATAYYPTLAEPYLTQNVSVYGHSVYPSWIGINNFLLVQLSNTPIDTTTMIDEAPFFNAYLALDGSGQPNATQVLFFRNGDVLRTQQLVPYIEILDGQQMFRMLNPQRRYKTALSGKLPAMPLGFVTFAIGESEDAASAVTLHRYANKSVLGPIRTFVLDTLSVDDGYATQVRCYDYQDISASADASGTVVRFHRVSVYQGCLRPGDARYGRTTTYFYNGLPPSTPGVTSFAARTAAGEQATQYSALDGMMIRQEQWDARSQLVSSIENTWQVADQVATDAAGTQLRNLYGGVPQVAYSTRMIDGVQRTTEYTYSTACGAPNIVISNYFDSTGQLNTRQQSVTFAYEKYPDMWTRNLLRPAAQTLTYVRQGTAPAQVVSNVVQTARQWTRPDGSTYWAEWQSYLPLQADAPAFGAWTGGDPGPAWKRSEEILTRTMYGQTVESVDTQGRRQALLYDDQARVVIAQFVNASSADGISYDSFEPYQQTSWSFSVAGGGALIDGDSFSGARCYEVRQSGTLAKSVNVAGPNRCVFAVWYKTPAGAAAGSVTVSLQIAAGGQRLTRALALTDGAWDNAQWVVDLTALGITGPSAVELRVVAGLSGTGTFVRVDDICFTPLVSQFSASVFDLERLCQTATLGLNAACQRTLRNTYGGVLARSGVYENPVALSATFYSLQTAATFQPTLPNFVLNAGGRDAGFLDEFKDGALGSYTFIDSSAADWSVAERELRLVSPGGGPLGARVRRTGFAAASLAASVGVDPPATGSASLGTGTFFVVWTGSQWQLGKLAGGVFQVLASNTGVAFQSEWLLCVFDDRLLFLAGGIQVFNYSSPDVAAAAPHGVELGLTAPGGFSQLVVAQTISLSVNYSDGLTRATQSVSMESGGAVILTGKLYDDRGLPAITLLPSRVTTAQVSDPFAYYAGYVTNAGFDSSLWQGAPLTGPAASVYHPDTGGYPFTRQVFEAAPTARVVQLGKPGTDFAITQAGNPHITTNSYTYNTDTGPFLYALPVGQYLIVSTTDPDGNVTETWSDTEEHRIGVIVKGAGVRATGWLTSMVFDAQGRPTASIPPKYYAQNPVRSGGAPSLPGEATTAGFNYLGQRTSVSNPDQGQSRCVYDYGTQPRFMQDAAGAAQGFVRYVKYDVLNRPIEDGYIDMQWDEAFLQDKARNDPSWPTSPTAWNTRRVYDGDDQTPAMVGRLWQALANNPDQASALVTDTFGYDRLGGVLTKTRQSAAFTPGQSYTLENTYDSLGTLTSTRDNVTGLLVTWTYNPRGQVLDIAGGVNGRTLDLAAYAWTQEGRIATVDLLPSGGTSLAQRQFSYNAPDWRLGSDDPTFSEALEYVSGSCQGAGYYSGAVAHQTVTYKDGQAGTQDDCFTVDALSQITAAGSGAHARTWTIDDNGNFQTRVRGAVTDSYSYPSSTSNQVQSVTSSDGQLQRSYLYGPTGDVQTITGPAGSMQFTYSRATGRVTSVSLPGASVVYTYDPSGQRTLRTTTGGSAGQSFTLSEQRSLLQLPGSDAASAVRYIVASGLVIAFTQGQYYFGLLDHLGSTRTILAQSGALAGEISYDLYGMPTVVTAPPFPYAFWFTGQPWNPLLGLYEFSARLYDPLIGRFVMVDPALEQPSPYVFVGNNPMMAVDPTGMIAWYWYLLAFTVGALVTVATGGLGAVAFGTGIGAAMAVGAVAGALGALASDGILALGGEHISIERLLIDVLSGGVAGVAGAGVGGALGQLTSRAGLNAGWSASKIIVTSSLVSGISGGVAGAAAGAGTTAILTGQPFFSKATALNMLLGAVTGAGSGLMAAGVHLGWLTGPGSLRTVPVEVSPNDPNIVGLTPRQQYAGEDYAALGAFNDRVRVMNPYQADSTMARFGLAHDSSVIDVVQVLSELTTVHYEGATIQTDTVAVHGVGRYVMVEWRNPNTGVSVNRPMTGANFARYLQLQGFGTGRPIRLISCFGALPGRFSVARALANTFQQDVYAHWKVVYPEIEPSWFRFRP